MKEDNYEDIIALDYKKSPQRSHMSIENRSAQFAPFAALTGYEEAINETSRLTSKKINIDEELKENLNTKLNLLKEHLKTKPLIMVTYFIKDKTKSGGKYVSITNNLTKINDIECYIQLIDKTKIYFKDILNIECENIKSLDEFYE